MLKHLRVDVCPVHKRLLEVVDTEDYSGVIRKAREELIDIGKVPTEDYLQNGIENLKIYYAIALLDPSNGHAISAEIDPFWHAHILHSEQYMRFCNNVVGEYMHHIPLNRNDPRQMKNIRALYEYTIEVIDKLFIKRNVEFWPTIPTDLQLICYHKGNQDLYEKVQPFRLFEPSPMGNTYAFSC